MESMAARVTASLDKRKCFMLQTIIIVIYYYERFVRCSNYKFHILDARSYNSYYLDLHVRE